MKKNQQKTRHAEWHMLIEECDKSGLSQTDFCQQKKIKLSHFYYYRSRIKAKIIPKESSFTPIHLQKSYTTADVQIILPNGLKCVLPCATDLTHIKQIVGALLSC
jgi:hypothetical protein